MPQGATMRVELLMLSMLLAGCQTQPAPVSPPVPTEPVPTLEQQEHALRREQQLRALVAHADALEAQVKELGRTKPCEAPSKVVEKPIASNRSAPRAAVGPNAEGVIDLTAAVGEAGNPFAIRVVPADAVREANLRVTGLIAGRCALVNGRTIEVGESIESFQLVEVEPGAIVLQRESHVLRLPVGPKATRVRYLL